MSTIYLNSNLYFQAVMSVCEGKARTMNLLRSLSNTASLNGNIQWRSEKFSRAEQEISKSFYGKEVLVMLKNYILVDDVTKMVTLRGCNISSFCGELEQLYSEKSLTLKGLLEKHNLTMCPGKIVKESDYLELLREVYTEDSDHEIFRVLSKNFVVTVYDPDDDQRLVSEKVKELNKRICKMRDCAADFFEIVVLDKQVAIIVTEKNQWPRFVSELIMQRNFKDFSVVDEFFVFEKKQKRTILHKQGANSQKARVVIPAKETEVLVN